MFSLHLLPNSVKNLTSKCDITPGHACGKVASDALQMEGVEPLASPDDCLLAEQIAKADPKVREQLKLRGVTDIDLVACDPWSGWCLPIPCRSTVKWYCLKT